MDDTVIYASARHPYTLFKILQKHIDNFLSRCTQRRAQHNEQKFTSVYFCKKLTDPNRTYRNNTTVPWTNHTKFLLLPLKGDIFEINI